MRVPHQHRWNRGNGRSSWFSVGLKPSFCVPGTCLSPILGLQPSKTRSFPIKTGVIWVPGTHRSPDFLSVIFQHFADPFRHIADRQYFQWFSMVSCSWHYIKISWPWSMSDPMPHPMDLQRFRCCCQVVTFPALSFLTENLSRMPQTQHSLICGAWKLDFVEKKKIYI